MCTKQASQETRKSIPLLVSAIKGLLTFAGPSLAGLKNFMCRLFPLTFNSQVICPSFNFSTILCPAIFELEISFNLTFLIAATIFFFMLNFSNTVHLRAKIKLSETNESCLKYKFSYE